ncbi:MAG: hypothetical protein RLN76_03620 [Phycisphaeraceae bacterium]
MSDRVPWSKIAAGKSVLLVSICLVVMTLSWPGALDGRIASLVWLWIGGATGWFMLTWLAWDLRSERTAAGCFKRASVIIVAVAALARVLVSLGGPPVLSDDIWRYIHDGATLAEGGNPYATAPAELDPAQAPLPEVVKLINNPELVTIYLPTSQWVFACAAVVYEKLPESWRAGDLLRDRWYRLVFGLFDLGVVIGLLLVLSRLRLSAWWACLYAWHPLALTEVAGSGHQDPIGVMFLVLVVWFWIGLRQRSSWRITDAIGLGGCLALSVLVKPLGVLLVPIIITTLWPRWRAILLSASSAVVVGCIVGLPFVMMQGGVDRLFETGERFVEVWSFNGSLHTVLMWLLDSKAQADTLGGATLLGVVLLLSWRKIDSVRAVMWLGFAGLLTTSTSHPWYALWMLPFCAIRPAASAWMLSLTLLWAYAAHTQPSYRLPSAVMWIEYLPVYALLVWDLWRAGRSSDNVSRHADQ